MKLVTILTAGCMAAALAACGGGGGDSPSTSPPVVPIPPVEASFDVTEFLGTWSRVDAAQCFSGFAYGNYYFKNDKFTLTASTVEVTDSLYTDVSCTVKAGTLTETFKMSYSAGSVAGKTNVARIQTTYVGTSASANGGPPLTLNKVPDGSQTGGSGKALFDVENSQLFGPDKLSPKDADGYPTKLNTTALFKRSA